MKLLLRCLLLLLIAPLAWAAPAEEEVKLKTPKGELAGTLLLPERFGFDRSVVLLLPGSGPTDRNGNSGLLRGENNSLKLLAESLAGQGIASLRIDKRGVGASRAALKSEKDLRFTTYVDDARAWLHKLETDSRFSHVWVIGHSEGALIGSIASQEEPISGFVSLCGAGHKAAETLTRQLTERANDERLPRKLAILKSLEKGKVLSVTEPDLQMLFRPSVQPYMISWFQFDPSAELAKLKVPVLIVDGGADLQVNSGEADLLAAAVPEARRVTIPKMNHVLKLVSGDQAANIAAYSDPSLPAAPALTEELLKFLAPHP